jgi:LysM repeat protein
MNSDQPGWPLCIRKFYWTSYRVKPGDTLFSLALATGSTVSELLSANCLPNSRINAGQVLYVPRSISSTILPTATATQTPSDTVTPSLTVTMSQTSTDMPTVTYTPTDTPSMTPTYTPTHTYTPTSTPTATEIPSSTPTSTPTIEINSAPSVGIESPLNDSRYPYAGRDETRNLWFSEVELRGVASDPEDDVVSSAVWSTDFSHPNASRVLGDQLTVKAILYSNVCTGMWHTVILTVKDSQGQAARARVRIFIGDQQAC